MARLEITYKDGSKHIVEGDQYCMVSHFNLMRHAINDISTITYQASEDDK
jgi:hypothetical protein